MTDKEKIIKVLDLQKVSIAKAEARTGLGTGTISKLIARNGKFHEENLKKFLRTFSVSLNWWNTGKGEIFEKVEEGNKPDLNEAVVEYVLVDKMIKTYETALASKNEEILRLVEDKKWLREHVKELTTKISSSQQA